MSKKTNYREECRKLHDNSRQSALIAGVYAARTEQESRHAALVDVQHLIPQEQAGLLLAANSRGGMEGVCLIRQALAMRTLLQRVAKEGGVPDNLREEVLGVIELAGAGLAATPVER